MPGVFVRHHRFLVWMEKKYGSRNSREFDGDATFFIKEDEFFRGYYSFESANFPGYYIRHQGYRLKLAKYNGRSLFKDDASFTIRT